jgi:flagellar motility protein MotE (MotC chaperone)
MTDVRSAISSVFAGVAVTGGIELAVLADWLAKPAVGGVVAMIVWYLQSRIRKQEEAEKAAEAIAKADRESLRTTLQVLRADVDAIRNALVLDGERQARHVAVLEERVASLRKDHDDAHNRWRREHEALMRECDEVGVDTKDACQKLETRLGALEAQHAAIHLTQIRS